MVRTGLLAAAMAGAVCRVPAAAGLVHEECTEGRRGGGL
jgi:hypothetical protein